MSVQTRKDYVDFSTIFIMGCCSSSNPSDPAQKFPDKSYDLAKESTLPTPPLGTTLTDDESTTLWSGTLSIGNLYISDEGVGEVDTGLRATEDESHYLRLSLIPNGEGQYVLKTRGIEDGDRYLTIMDNNDNWNIQANSTVKPDPNENGSFIIDNENFDYVNMTIKLQRSDVIDNDSNKINFVQNANGIDRLVASSDQFGGILYRMLYICK